MERWAGDVSHIMLHLFHVRSKTWAADFRPEERTRTLPKKKDSWLLASSALPVADGPDEAVSVRLGRLSVEGN